MGTQGCRALMISAPASGQGKTTVTAALARHYRERGLRVRVFKCGPDFLDPMVLERASGHAVHNLDLWMCGEDECRRLLAQAAEDADLILVEAVMGLFDGTPSSADLAEAMALPVMTVIDASAMAQTFGAIAAGISRWRRALRCAGVFANRVASTGHREMLAESLSPVTPLLGSLAQDAENVLPSRHLGLIQAEELSELESKLERLADTIDAPEPSQLPRVEFAAPAQERFPPALAGVRIAVARDAAFAFVYAANLELLKSLGAQLVAFSPLRASELPRCDALYLPGGYPELHLHRLSANRSLAKAIRRHHRAGKPTLAECGGMMYLMESLSTADGASAEMVGLLPGQARQQGAPANLGLHSITLSDGDLRAHTFHHCTAEVALAPSAMSRPQRHHGHPEAVWQLARLTASYLHLYLPSNPALAAELFTP